MFSKPEIRRLFVFDLALTNLLSGLPILYDNVAEKVVNYRKSEARFKVVHFCFFAYAMVVTTQFLQAHQNPIWITALSGFLTALFVLIWFVNSSVIAKVPDIVQLANRMFKFEQTHHRYFNLIGRLEKKSGCQLVILIDLIGTTCTPPAALAFFGFFLIQPCCPGNFGYQLFFECCFQKFPSFLTLSKISLAAYSALQFACSVSIIPLVNTQFGYVFCYCFQNYLKYFQYLYNCSGSKLSRIFNKSGDKNSQVLLVYRQIQLLIQQQNEIHQHFIVVGMLFMASLGVTVALYVTITLINQGTSLIQILFFFAVGLDCFLIMVVLSGMQGRVYTTSEETLRLSKQPGKFQKNAWAKRVIRSFQPLKIGFGSVNFFDRFTGINVFQFSIDQTVNLLLM